MLDDDKSLEKAIFNVENEAGRFPDQMLLVNNIFEFSFQEFQTLLQTNFAVNAELVSGLQTAIDYVQSSHLDAQLKAEVLQLLDDEAEVVSYAQSARCSVISM